MFLFFMHPGFPYAVLRNVAVESFPSVLPAELGTAVTTI